MSITLKACAIHWRYEDELEAAFTDGMYEASMVIDGVRMYPYIITDGAKIYLESWGPAKC